MIQRKEVRWSENGALSITQVVTLKGFKAAAVALTDVHVSFLNTCDPLHWISLTGNGIIGT